MESASTDEFREPPEQAPIIPPMDVTNPVGCPNADQQPNDNFDDDVGRDEFGRAEAPLYRGQVFQSVDECLKFVNDYLTTNKFLTNFECSQPKKEEMPDYKYYRWRCKRAGSNRGKNTGARPDRVSLKCNCAFYISAAPPKSDSEGQLDNSRDTTKLEIIAAKLEHTNECNGYDENMNSLLTQCQGRKYDSAVLNSLRSDVRAGRYSTLCDVQSKLREFVYANVSMEEATNVRYRLLKGLPIKDWAPESRDEEEEIELGTMEDFLYNTDLAAEIQAGGRESIEKLQLLHEGLSSKITGYDYRTATDSEGRFTGTISEKIVQKWLPNVSFCGACIWHITVLDFPKNLKHMPDYQSCKYFFTKHLVHNTVDKLQWESYLSEACRKWPIAADYLQTLAKQKERWGHPWRMGNLTLGYEASSPAESSFSAFKRALGDAPKSFVGVIQLHIRKDEDRIIQERRDINRGSVQLHDTAFLAKYSDAVNQCRAVYSEHISMIFHDSNIQSLDYANNQLEVSDEERLSGVEEKFSVSRRLGQTKSERIVVKSHGKWRCGCLEGENHGGGSCRHIQCANGGAFDKSVHFLVRWEAERSVDFLQAVHRNNHATALCHPVAGVTNDAGGGGGSRVAELDGDNNVFNNTSGECEGPDHNCGDDVDDNIDSVEMNNQVAISGRQHKKQKRLSSYETYNNLLGVGQEIAKRVSAESRETYEKVHAVMKFLLSNFQRSGEVALKEATANYVGVAYEATVESVATSDVADNVEFHSTIPLSPPMKRSAGSISMKRKKSSVEHHVGHALSKRGGACQLYKQYDHNKGNCPAAKLIGNRITPSTWPMLECCANVKVNEEVIDTNLIDPVVPKDCIGVQVIEYSTTSGGMTVFKCYPVLIGMTVDDNRALWLLLDTLCIWANKGKSGSHYVFVKDF